MTITLPASVMETLPEADGDGNIRIVVSLQGVQSDGTANISQINDVPVSGDEEEPETDPLSEEQLPSPDDIASQVMQG